MIEVHNNLRSEDTHLRILFHNGFGEFFQRLVGSRDINLSRFESSVSIIVFLDDAVQSVPSCQHAEPGTDQVSAHLSVRRPAIITVGLLGKAWMASASALPMPEVAPITRTHLQS